MHTRTDNKKGARHQCDAPTQRAICSLVSQLHPPDTIGFSPAKKYGSTRLESPHHGEGGAEEMWGGPEKEGMQKVTTRIVVPVSRQPQPSLPPYSVARPCPGRSLNHRFHSSKVLRRASIRSRASPFSIFLFISFSISTMRTRATKMIPFFAAIRTRLVTNNAITPQWNMAFLLSDPEGSGTSVHAQCVPLNRRCLCGAQNASAQNCFITTYM